MRPLAVLFDFDGVISDTENVHVAAMERTLALMGWEIDPDDSARAAEEDDAALLRELLAARGVVDADLNGWIARKQALTTELLHDSPRLYPGVACLVEAIRGQARLGIVTTTDLANVRAVLTAAKLTDRFEIIVSKGDSTRPKPADDPYRTALERLRLAPEQAVAIEDSPTGLASARAAGIRVVAVGHRRPIGDWSRTADATLPDFRDLPASLKALGL